VTAREELRRVESFDELRASMLVLVRQCMVCGRDCQFILLSFSEGGWAHAPDCYPHGDGSRVRRETVAEGRVFEVMTGYDPATEARTKRNAIAADRVVTALRRRGVKAARLLP
jgi:hypothetical protein